MVWPFRLRRSKNRTKLRKQSARKTKSMGVSAASTPSDVAGPAVSRTTDEVADSSGVALCGAAVETYACHYCERTEGVQTRDHKLPRMFGGAGLPGNIVRCCQMCNIIKGSRPYNLFVVFFGQFLEVHGEEYRTANPDEGETIGTMARKFNAWLHGLQHAEELTKFEGV
jgi:5-methylcytosine-specific restriction endonuclease McrA